MRIDIPTVAVELILVCARRRSIGIRDRDAQRHDRDADDGEHGERLLTHLPAVMMRFFLNVSADVSEVPTIYILGPRIRAGMRIDELDVPDAVADALTSAGFRELHPPQAEAIPLALEGSSVVAAIPTASGKSLIGIVPALKMLAEKRGKVLYIVPLKALAAEKADDFRAFGDVLGFKVHMSTGDLDSEDRGLEDADVVIATSEKTDSMIRHGSGWIDRIGLIIADEIHMIHDAGRGPTLEVALTKLMRKLPDVQVIALSATISNARDISNWLKARLVTSDWRPIPLREGVFLAGRILFDDAKTVEVPNKDDAVESLVVQTLKDGGQCLVFVNSRRSTEAEARRISDAVASVSPNPLNPQEIAVLQGGAESTDLGIKLASCVAKGVAFHNAGLTYAQRRAVEQAFKARRIKCIVATPTLAAGINLPARRVVVRDTTRFENGGTVPIPVMEVKQMCGRAGRPGFDPYGEAVLIAKSEKDRDHLMRDYVEHETERITSKLFSGNIIRTHILGVLATGDADSEEGIVAFIRDTFYGATSQMFGVESVVEEVVDFLEHEQMVRRTGDRIDVLPFGKRVSDLYIDPVSASMLHRAVERIDEDTSVLPMLVAAAMTPDVMGMYPKKADAEWLKTLYEGLEDRLLLDPDELEDYMSELFYSDLKVAAMVDEWIEEAPEEAITKRMGIGPGDIRSRMDMMDWIVYAMGEIAYIFNPPAIRRIRPLSVRIRYGVKEELSDLVALKGVGRTRARILFDRGYRDRDSISSADEHELASIPGIGPALASSMKRQTGTRAPEAHWTPPSEEEELIDEMAAAYGEEPAGDDKRDRRRKEEETGPKQASLLDFRSLGEDALDLGDRVRAAYGLSAVVEDRVGVLEPVAGADAHDALVPVDHSLGAELLESGDGRGGGGLHTDALLPSEQLLGRDDLLVGDGGGVSAGGVDGLEGLPSADRVPDPDGGGYGLGVVLRDEVRRPVGECLGDGRRALGLNAGEHGDLVDPSDLLQLHAGLVDGPDVGGVADGQDDPVGDVVPQLVHDLEQDGLLSLGPVGVDGVEEVQLPLLGHPPGQCERVVEVPVDGEDLGSEEQGLGQLAHGDLSGREEHRALHSGLRSICGQGSRRVPGGGATDDLGPELLGAGDSDRHTAVLEGSGGIQSLELDEGLGDSHGLSERRGGVQRGSALLDRDLVGRIHGHERSVSPDAYGLRTEILRLHLLDGLEVHLDRQKPAASGACVDERVVDLCSAIPANHLVCRHFQILLQPEPGSVIQVSHFMPCSEYTFSMLSAICSPSWEFLLKNEIMQGPEPPRKEAMAPLDMAADSASLM